MTRFIELSPDSIAVRTGAPAALPAGWARVRVAACGICGTDLHTYEGMDLQPGVSYPLRPGHEVAGIVTEIDDRPDEHGSGAEHGIAVGDHVALHPLLPCGTCRHCTDDAENRCTDALILGFHHPGGMADEVVWPVRRMVSVHGIALEQAALLPDAVATAYHAFVAARPPSGGSMCVIGAGGVGTHLLQIAAALDPTLRLAAVVRSEATAERLRASGVLTIVGLDGATRAARQALGTVDVTVDFSGATAAPRVGARMLGAGGRLVLGSVDDNLLELGITITTAMTRELQIVGTYSSTLADLQASADLVRSGRLDLSESASLQFGLDDVVAALHAVAERPNGLVRAVVRP